MNSFKEQSANSENPKWNKMIERQKELYSRENDLRTNFERDYTRVIHSNAYRRLKHKTQVFFSPESDHICTRIEHVTHVESISYTIAKNLGLNTELTRAIATAHDIGHSPFGHQGEKILSEISKKYIGKSFWHEKNGLDFVDKIELLEDNLKNKQNLNLTYAVRDGIISHCGEIDENSLKPRDENINLDVYTKPNEYAPYTWEACVVKLADKIAYLGRDIEDAISIGILDEHLEDLYRIINSNDKINNTVIINNLVYDICQNSSLEKGLCFSNEVFENVKEIKKFNYKYIYLSDRLKSCTRYFTLILNELFSTLANLYDESKLIYNLKSAKRFYPELINGFEEWISRYWNLSRNDEFKNDIIFNMNKKEDYYTAIIYYISGMTDNYAIEMYNKIIGF